ncbi:MAG: DUF4422 domain-containing protein [Prevotellaceae bacterium]|nr:DUF4422 domain-containing protein [Prevotellaceae bacterium]
MNIKILVATHKACEMPKDDVYLPVQVGKALHPDKGFGYQPDNEGKNISVKNPYYSELTAMYWAWKNLRADYIGLAHYRRHFRLKRKGGDWKSILTGKEAETLCKANDIILPKKRKLYIETIYSHYDHTFDGKHLDDARNIIAETCPEYLPFFDKTMDRKSAHFFNMFIMKCDLFDSYCTWMFPILERLESCYDLKGMDPFQARLIGRVSERLLDVWIEKNGLRYKEIGYIYFGKNNYHKKVIGFIMAKFFGKKYKKSFCL